MATLVYPIYGLIGCGLLIWAALLWRGSPSLGLAVAVAVLGAICYDAFVIAGGRLIGAGGLLIGLSWIRFVLHVLLTPLLLVAVVDLARRVGLPWAGHSNTWIAVWTIAAGLIALGIATDVVGIELEPHVFQGTLRYAEAVTVPPIATIAVIILLVIISGVFWRGTRWPWLFAATVITLLSGGVPVSLAGPALTSGAEIILLGCLLITERRFGRMNIPAAARHSEVAALQAVER